MGSVVPGDRPPPICAGDTVLLADVGNTRIKLAVVTDRPLQATPRGLPAMSLRQDLLSREFRPENVRSWLQTAAPASAVMLIAGVNESAAVRLEAVIAEVSATGVRPLRQRRVRGADLPLDVQVEEPLRVGIDRLAGAAAAAVVKTPGRGAIVVDCGTATTVDVVSPGGVFLGGAILAGPGLLARALAEGTSRLPEVAALESGSPPAMPGRSTQAAIAAGIGWGMRGAVARLVAEGRKALEGERGGVEIDVFLTGGSAGIVRDALPDAIEVPDLVLAGIALAAERACAR
jgi:type III pantothenate kinase